MPIAKILGSRQDLMSWRFQTLVAAGLPLPSISAGSYEIIERSLVGIEMNKNMLLLLYKIKFKSSSSKNAISPCFNSFFPTV
jgi:hypothetical protein